LITDEISEGDTKFMGVCQLHKDTTFKDVCNRSGVLGSLAETPERWTLQFQTEAIFADIFPQFVDNFFLMIKLSAIWEKLSANMASVWNCRLQHIRVFDFCVINPLLIGLFGGICFTFILFLKRYVYVINLNN